MTRRMEQRDIAVFGRTGEEAVPMWGRMCVDIVDLDLNKYLWGGEGEVDMRWLGRWWKSQKF